MSEQVPDVSRIPAEELLHHHRNIFYKYHEKWQEVEQFAAANAALAVINETLPRETHRIVAETSFYQPTIVYERDETSGAYVKRSTILTEGKSYKFIGDRFEVVEGELVVVDSELGGGINVFGLVAVKSLTDMGHRQREESYTRFLDLVAQTDPGQDARFDFLFY